MQGAFTKGFTLIELIATLVLLSILGVVAFGRLGGIDVFEAQGFYRDTLTAVRYAQKLAVATGCEVQVSLNSGDYALGQRPALSSDPVNDCGTGAGYGMSVMNPANRTTSYQGSAPADVTISPTATFRFTPQSTVAGLAGDTTFTIAGSQFTIYVLSGLVDAP